MSEKTAIKNTQSTALVDNKAMPFSIFNRPLLLSLLVFILLACLFSLLIFERYQLTKESRQKEALEIAHQAKDKLQESLTHSLAATKMLAFLIDKNGQVNNFDSIAPQIFESAQGIDAVQLVPGGVIQYMYPLNGNEKAIGYNILQDTARNKDAYKAIKSKKIFFAGPFELKQGGIGVVGRLPVFRQNKFWGFSAVVIKMSTLYEIAGIDTTGSKGYYFQLSKFNPDTKQEEFFLPQHKELSNNQAVSVDVPNGEWRLSINGELTRQAYGDIFLFALPGLLLAVLAALAAYRFAIRPKKLRQLVLNRTSELKASENNYRSLIERVSDAFVAMDSNWLFTYANEQAGQILGREPQSLIGKNVWKEFPEAVNQPFYQAYLRAMQTQEYQYIEEYYPPFDKWIENHIYPSKDGLTVFFKDVTSMKQIALALEQKEEKYHTLIEQASDGIVISDMEGIILEVNKSIQQMIGYNDDELIGYHLTDFLPEEDMEANPLRINELMQGKSLLYERRLKRKDGTFLDVELNSKMASSHTLIGFIRDITERKKIENKLLYQASLLQSVSDAVTSLDINNCIVSWNIACEELYGFTTAEVMGKRMAELLTFEYPNTNNEEVFKQLYAEGKWKGEFNFIHPKTKEKINLLSNINVLKDNKGAVNGFIITSKNITDRIKAEEEIKKSNERFELIAEATNDAIWDHDFTRNETWGNKNLYDIYGIEYGKEKINFEMFLQHISPQQQQGIQERMRIAIENKKVFLSEIFRFKNAKNEYRTFYDRAYIKYDESGKPLRILGAMQDISEREEAQKAIVESEEKYRTIIEQAADGIFIADENTYLLDVNTAGCKMTGYTKAEMQKLRFIDVIPAEDLATNPMLITQMEKGRSVINERRLICKDGSIIDVEISAKKLMDGRYQLFVRDIAERKKAAEILLQSEQKYRLLFYNNPLPMWMTTMPGLDIIDVNESAIKQYGYSREEFLKMNTRNLRPAEDVENFLKDVDTMKPDIINTRTWRHKKKDGTVIQVETYSHQIMYEGKPAWLGLSHDVTDKYIAEERLQKSYDDIRQLAANLQSIREDERTTIAREIHDELGQQLTGLKMDIYWLSRKINTTDAEITAKLNESIELINATVSSVRKIATDLRPSILDDLGLVAALEWQGEEFEKRSGIHVEFNNEAGDILLRPDTVTAIFRIYQELLTNVARHANASLVNVLLQKKGNSIFFTLTDDGAGFDPETISKKKTLGLLGIKERTLLLGGTYEFKSSPGQGSQTMISIPIAT